MYKPVTKEAYDKVLPLPEMDDAEAVLKTGRALLIISPDGKTLLVLLPLSSRNWSTKIMYWF